MRILVIDQCSKAKAQDDSDAYDADGIDGYSSLEELRSQTEKPIQKARKLYTGRQQQYISQAIDKLEEKSNDTVERYFISAGFGLVSEKECLPPYDVTFRDYSSEEVAERASKLEIKRDMLDVVTGTYDVIFFALGRDYYRTFDVATVLKAIPSDTWVVCFNHESVTAEFENVLSLSARTEEAKELGTIVVALKGKYFQNFADYRSNGAQVNGLDDIETYCTTEYTSQSNFDTFEG